MTKFLHGVEVLEIDAGPRPIRTVRSSVIGIVGTAPSAKPDVKATLLTGTVSLNNSLTFTSKKIGSLGNAISIAFVNPGTVSSPISVSVVGDAITVSLATGANSAITSTAANVKTAIDGSAAAAALVSVANTQTSTGVGVVDALAAAKLTGGIDEPFPLNTPVLIAGSRAEAAKLDTIGTGLGTLPNALEGIFDQIGAVVVVIRVQEGADEAATIANVIGGVNSTTGQYEGVQALLGAESVVGFAPRILCAPGFTHQRPGATPTANPVVAELIGIAERMRAVIIADGPNTTDAAAITYAGDFGSARVYLVDPWATVFRNGAVTIEPASARVAGLIAKVDNDRGFWWSPSNNNINGIVGTARPVDFKLGDANSRANLLNEKNVATIIRQDGFRLWGNRTLSSDPKFAFISVRRTADILNESLQRAHLWAVDRNITKTYISDVEESVNAYIRTLIDMGALLGGRCYADPDLNTAANITQGKVFFNFDFTPPYPAEHITFRSILTNDYISEVFS
jgi:phage tail sheath protein FI